MKNAVKHRSFLNKSDLVKSKGQMVATLNAGNLGSVDGDLTLPGFYFLVHARKEIVYSRYYVGRQRTKQGFLNIASQIKLNRSKVSIFLNTQGTFLVYFIPADSMKALTTAHNKGRLQAFFTKNHFDGFQNLEEMNRLLNDNFKFFAQKY